MDTKKRKVKREEIGVMSKTRLLRIARSLKKNAVKKSGEVGTYQHIRFIKTR